MKRFYIYQFDTYQELQPTGVKQDYCQVDVYAHSEKEALTVAKSLIKKNHYDLVKILEYFAPAENRPSYLVMVQAHNLMNVDAGTLQDSIPVHLWAGSVDEAIKRAKTLVKRKFYRVGSIIQKLSEEV